MKRTTIFLLLAVVAGAALSSGCAEDILSGVTTIFGTVVDPGGAPIFDIRVGITYTVRRVSGSPAGITRAPAGITRAAAADLSPPYPNPTIDPEGTDVFIPLTADADTTARVEIWGVVGGVAARISTIFTGDLPAGGRTIPWNGRDQFDRPLGNGLYHVRLLVPAGATSAVAEYPVLINRTEGVVATRDVYSAVSDPDGNYLLDNIPVGERITETNSSGSVLGTAVVDNQVLVFFHDPDYQGGPEPINIGPGETVEVVTVLRSINPGLAPVFGPGPLSTSVR